MNEVIEPDQKHEVRADVSVAQLRNNKVFASIAVPPNFERNPIYAVAAVDEQQEQQERPTQSVGPTEETDQKKINQAKAVYNKCLQIMNKIKFPEEQGQQICQLLVESTIIAVEDEEQQQEPSQQKQQQNNKPPGTPSGNVSQQGPPMSGFVGNAINGTTTPATSCTGRTAATLSKEIEIKKAQIEKLDIELAKEKQVYQARQARIAELEEQNYRLGLESYLRKHIDSENMVHYQAMKFASKGFNVDDLKDIYEDIPVRRTASKNIPKSKVRLRTASTDESNYDSNDYKTNSIKDTNEKLTNAFFGISSNSNNNSDYLSDSYVG